MRHALLEAALRAFGEHGYEGTSLRDLARQLGVSHNLVHHHYGSKCELWKAALEHGCAPSGRELLSLVEANSSQSDWEVANREGVTGAIMLFARRPAVAKIMADESARGGPRLDFLFDRYIKPFAGLLENLLAGAPQADERDVDARAALLFLFAGLTAPFTLCGLASKLDGSPAMSRRDLARFATTVAGVIAHGLGRVTRGGGARNDGRTAAPRAAIRRKAR